MLIKQQKRHRRHKKVRARIEGTAEIPRLCVFRSSKHIYAQLINDEKWKTLVAAGDLEIKSKKTKKSASAKSRVSKEEKVKNGKVALAYRVGELIAQKALEKKVEKIVFDRGGYKYHGRVKALAEGARKGGLKF